jgi:hypothetical protein
MAAESSIGGSGIRLSSVGIEGVSCYLIFFSIVISDN